MAKQKLKLDKYTIVTWDDFKYDPQLILHEEEFGEAITITDNNKSILTKHKHTILSFFQLYGEETTVRDKNGKNLFCDDIMEEMEWKWIDEM